MHTGIRITFLGLPILLALTGCAQQPKIEFAPYGEGYESKPDFAKVEHDYPLRDSEAARAELSKITPKYLANLEQEQVDQMYARLTAGHIPDGPFDGEMFFPKGTSGKAQISEVVGGGLPGLAVDLKVQKLEAVGEGLWKGKVFYRDDMVLRNRIDDLVILKPMIEGDLSDIPTVTVDGREQWLLFPAKLYCGQSLLDGRRESIIIDYAFTDEIEGYRERPDALAGRNGFKIRDEIRMIRPGFYLGRAYMDKNFALNFTLYNEAIAEQGREVSITSGAVAEDCWTGT